MCTRALVLLSFVLVLVCVLMLVVVLARAGRRSQLEPPNATSAGSFPAEVFLTGRALLERSGIG